MMKSIIKYLFVFIPLFSWSADINSQSQDSDSIEVRHFDKSAMEEHKADSDFDYGVRPVEELSLWERFKIWLKRILSDLFYYGAKTPVAKILVYLLIAAVIGYAIYKLISIRSKKLFYGAKADELDYDLFHENIHQMDFEKLIDEAVNNKNYRLAIRLIYLFALKKLADQQLIDWQPGKTNFDYVREVEPPQLKQGFNDLSYYFDYSWYGDFEVNQSLFQKVEGIFNNWKNKLNK